MSYDISLSNPETGETLEVGNHQEGSIIAIGGVPFADMNVTYNYSKHFDFRSLHGKTGQETIPVLAEAVRRLGTIRDRDYWATTPGNAGYACSVLLGWAAQHSTGKWDVN